MSIPPCLRQTSIWFLPNYTSLHRIEAESISRDANLLEYMLSYEDGKMIPQLTTACVSQEWFFHAIREY